MGDHFYQSLSEKICSYNNRIATKGYIIDHDSSFLFCLIISDPESQLIIKLKEKPEYVHSTNCFRYYEYYNVLKSLSFDFSVIEYNKKYYTLNSKYFKKVIVPNCIVYRISNVALPSISTIWFVDKSLLNPSIQYPNISEITLPNDWLIE